MTCDVVATSISGCDVCTACRVVCKQYTHHSLKYLLPQRLMSYNDVFSLINSTINKRVHFLVKSILITKHFS
jgi:hypothetical protein